MGWDKFRMISIKGYNGNGSHTRTSGPVEVSDLTVPYQTPPHRVKEANEGTVWLADRLRERKG